MKIKVVAQSPAPGAATLTAWVDLPERPFAPEAAFKSHPAFADLSRRRKANELKAAYLASGAAPLLYLPAGLARPFDADDKARTLAARAFEAAAERQAAQLVLPCTDAATAALAAEGIALVAYRFTQYKASAVPSHEPEVVLVVDAGELTAAKKSVARRLEIAASVNRARDLVNEPGSVATPAEIQARARAVAKKHGIKITVLQAAQLKREGYNGLLMVGKGGPVPPRMIVLNYNPPKAPKATHLGLLGKGITFDSGGYSIKPGNNMWQMKGDMAGAAAVLYALEAIAAAKLPVRITGVIVTAQNMVDSNAIVPGDIFKAKNGKTVHVDNTDAEGRLILSDGLARMGEEKVTHLVDVATLTGACVRALGPALSGAFGAGELLKTVMDAAATQGEPCWELPLVEEYADWLKFEIADLNNITGKMDAGASTAALFLREFVPADTDWVHLDIAGTFITDQPRKYYRPGATGIMVRTFVKLAEAFAK
jgi:leucyl aminopeptidase